MKPTGNACGSGGWGRGKRERGGGGGGGGTMRRVRGIEKVAENALTDLEIKEQKKRRKNEEQMNPYKQMQKDRKEGEERGKDGEGVRKREGGGQRE